MKKILLVIFFTVITTVVYSQNIINDNNVNVRDYPSVSQGKLVGQLNTNQKVSVYYKTKSMDTINGKTNYWYKIETVDKKITGWIFGDFIKLGKDNYIIEVVKENILRIQNANELLNKLFHGDGLTAYNLDLIKNYKVKESQLTSFWQMNESGYTQLNTYDTEYGELIAFVNIKENTWRFEGLKITKNNISEFFKINVDLKYYQSTVGNDFKINKDKIEYELSDYDDSFVYQANKVGDTVISFELWKFFD